MEVDEEGNKGRVSEIERNVGGGGEEKRGRDG